MRPENRPSGNSVLLHPSSLKRSEVAEAGKVGGGTGEGGGRGKGGEGARPLQTADRTQVMHIIRK
jgi:hypothetical protein